MKELILEIKVKEYDNLDELTYEERKLMNIAREATLNAYAPYSNYYVGAAVLLENGEIVTGNNQENVAYPSGLCAERVALFAASATYPNVKIKAIAITSRARDFIVDSPVSPCGACRQVISEYEMLAGEKIKVILMGQQGKIQILEGIENLLPLVFKESNLKK